MRQLNVYKLKRARQDACENGRKSWDAISFLTLHAAIHDFA